MHPSKSNFNPAAPFQTIPNASRITGLSQFYLRQGCKSGSVPHLKIGNSYQINIPLLLQKLNAESERSAAALSA